MAETGSERPPAGTEPLVLARRGDAPRVELDLALPAGLLYFEGHFDGFAILPGVVQIHWALRLARRHLGLGDGAPTSMQVKFRRPIRPGALLALALERVSLPGGERLAFAYRSGPTLCADGKIVLGGS